MLSGLLLCTHLDALFNQGLLNFTDEGTGLFSAVLNAETVDCPSMRTCACAGWRRSIISTPRRPFAALRLYVFLLAKGGFDLVPLNSSSSTTLGQD